MYEPAAGFRRDVVPAEVAPSRISYISGEDGQGGGARCRIGFHISEDAFQGGRTYRFRSRLLNGDGKHIEISGRFDGPAELQSDFTFQIFNMSFPVPKHLSFSDSDVAMKQGTNLHFFLQ